MGGFLTTRHYELRDITASLLTEVSHVAVEPHVQPLSGEGLSFRSSNTSDFVVFRMLSKMLFDIWVFDPTASSYRSLHGPTCNSQTT